MRRLTSLTLLAAVATAITPNLSRAWSATRGPAGVVATIRGLCAAIDANDERRIAAFLGADEGGFHGTVAGGDLIAFRGADQRAIPFLDAGFDGNAIAAGDPATFVRRVAVDINAEKAEARTLSTDIRSIWADCPAPSCSYAVLEFVRRYRIDGDQQIDVPMRATALLRHDPDREHQFVIYHWHASPAGEPIEPGAKRGAKHGG